MRALAIAAFALVVALVLLPGAAARPVPSVPIHVEVVQCIQPPCPPQVWCDPEDTGGAIRYERFHDCSERISIDIIDCVWNETWVTYTVGPLTVRYTTCSGPDPW